MADLDVMAETIRAMQPGWEPPCPVCSPTMLPLAGGPVHTICHPTPRDQHGVGRDAGCGHSLDDHTADLHCRVCGDECGVDCRPFPRTLLLGYRPL